MENEYVEQFYKIFDIAYCHAEIAQNVYFELKHPQIGEQNDVYAILVEACFAPLSASVQVKEIHIISPIHTITITEFLPTSLSSELKERYPGIRQDACLGFRSHVCILGLPKIFTLEVLILCQRTHSSEMTFERVVTIKGEKRPFPHLFGDERQPLCLISLGRTGTTWVMRLLAEHPEILSIKAYPYEYRYGMYWMQMLKMLSSSWNKTWTESTTPEFNHSLHFYGHHPFTPNPLLEQILEGNSLRNWFFKGHVENVISFCKQNLAAYYDQVANAYGKENALFFLEKFGSGYIPQLFSDLYEHPRQIILIRDFRDVFCSMKAFNRKRGFKSFGEKMFENDEAWIARLAENMYRLYLRWEKQSDSVYLLRYEDVMIKPILTLREILQYIGVNTDEHTIQMMLDFAQKDTIHLKYHRTSRTPRESVGRWRKELEQNLQRFCHERLSYLLQEMGYPS